MHSMVPILMSLGGIAFVIGIFVFARFGLQQIKQVKFFGKEFKLWRFTTATVGSGILLILLSIFIHKSVPYVPESSTQQPSSAQAANTDFEQELALSDINSKAMVAYIKSFQKEYQTALNEEDKTTINLLRMELQFRLRTELEDRGLEGSQLEQEVKRIMERLPQNNK
ncbi:MAG: hypothetical protein H0V39_04520 [Nitrosomonas sp.]|nr:hypothetical protein [Nitrosomonas sp.]